MGQNNAGNILILPLRRSDFWPDFWDIFIILFTICIVGGMLFPLSLSASIPTLGIFFFIAYIIKFKSVPPIPRYLVIWLCVLLVTMGLGQIWAVWSDDSLSRLSKVWGIITPSFLLTMVAVQCPLEKVDAHKNWVFCALCLPLFLISARLYLPHFFLSSAELAQTSITLDRASFSKNVAFIAMTLPSLLALSTHKNYKQKIVFLLGLVPLFLVTESQASQLSIIIMAAVGFGLLPFLSSFTRKAVGGGLIIFALLMPYISAICFDFVSNLPLYGSFIPTTGLMRLENWDFITREILKSPWVGFGMDSARHMIFTSDKIFYPLNELMHPHNGFLQMWLDFGVLGAIAIAIGIGIYISRRTNVIHFTTFVGAMIILLLSWSIWSSWLIGALFAVHTLIILASKSRNDQLTS